ncbi:MAG TPA: hypothetical protein VF589_10130 [Allosphingosinicella sp.]|jgi:hypothetical protein
MDIPLPPPSGDPPPNDPSAGTPRAAIPFDPVPVQPRRDGWTAERQRRFIGVLAETGVVRFAAAAAGMSESSAHRLAQRPDAQQFCNAWDAALRMAARPAAAKLYEYALDGMTETVWRDGEIVYQRRRPSEKALIFLLSRLDPVRFGRPPAAAPAATDRDGLPLDPLAETAGLFDLFLDNLRDLPPEEGYEAEAKGLRPDPPTNPPNPPQPPEPGHG